MRHPRGPDRPAPATRPPHRRPSASAAAGERPTRPAARSSGRVWAGRSVNSVPTGSTGAAGSTGQIGLRGIPAKIRSSEPSARSSAPCRRAGAPRRAARGSAWASAAITSASDVVRLRLEIRRGGLAGPGQVAGPPAGLGEVADPLVVEAVAAGQRLELGPGEPQRAEPEMDAGQDEVGAALVGVGRGRRPTYGRASRRQPQAALEPPQVAARARRPRAAAPRR